MTFKTYIENAFEIDYEFSKFVKSKKQIQIHKQGPPPLKKLKTKNIFHLVLFELYSNLCRARFNRTYSGEGPETI